MLEDANLLDNDLEGSGNRSWGTRIEVDGIAYATSLFWQPLQNASDYMQEVEDASNTVLEGADLFCIKGGKAPQFGICVSHEGFKSGENVAAVSLINALSDVSSFVAVFKVREGWWYVCVRNDIILSDGDMLFLTEDEAKSQFFSMMAVPDWGKKIAPAEWGLDETEEVDLGNLLSRGLRAKLQRIKGLRGSRLLMVVVISAIVGIWLISSLIDKLFLTPAQRPVVIPVKPKVAEQVVIQEQPKPWESIKKPLAVMESCYKGIYQLIGIMPPGWKIGSVSCIQSTVATNWKREFGRLSWAEEALKKSDLPFAGYSFDATGSELSASLPLRPVETISSAPAYNLTDLRNIINDQFQSLGLSILLADEVTQNQPTPAAETLGKGPMAAPIQMPQVIKRLKFSFDSPHDPLIWAELLTKYSGLEINIILYNPDTKIWHYEGAIYAL